MSRLEKLRARLAEITAELRTLSEIDAESLTSEQDDRFRALETELERTEGEGDAARTVGLLAEIAEEERRESIRSRALAGNLGIEGGAQPDAWRNTHGTPNVNTRTGDPFDTRSVPAYGPARAADMTARARDAVERSTRFVSDAHKESVTRHLQAQGRRHHYSEFVLLGADEHYADAFLRSLTGSIGGMAPVLTNEERSALEQRHMLARAMDLSDVTGVLVPTHLDTTLILATDGTVSPIRQIARVETGTTNVYQSLRTSGVTHDWVAEAAEFGDNAPSFDNPKATAFKGGVFIPISFEAYEDARGREAEIIMMSREAKRDAEAVVFVTGNGTDRPRGLITALAANSNALVNTTTSHVFGDVDVFKVYEALPPAARDSGNTAWLSNITIQNAIRQFGDQFPYETVSLGARQVPSILGHPWLETSTMDGTIGATSTDRILAVGDAKTYLVYDRLGDSFEFVPNLFGNTNGRPTGQRGWLMHHRTGGNLTIGAGTSDTVVRWRLLQATTNS